MPKELYRITLTDEERADLKALTLKALTTKEPFNDAMNEARIVFAGHQKIVYLINLS